MDDIGASVQEATFARQLGEFSDPEEEESIVYEEPQEFITEFSDYLRTSELEEKDFLPGFESEESKAIQDAEILMKSPPFDSYAFIRKKVLSVFKEVEKYSQMSTPVLLAAIIFTLEFPGDLKPKNFKKFYRKFPYVPEVDLLRYIRVLKSSKE